MCKEYVEKLARDGQVAGAGDGQKLRHALDQAQQDGCKERHGFHAPVFLDFGFPAGAGGGPSGAHAIDK